MMDLDLDWSLKPSETIYPCRAIMLDPANQDQCYQGTANARCVGITPQASNNAPGLIGNQDYPYPLAVPDTGDGSQEQFVSAYGPGRKCLWDVDPNFGGQVRPNDLLVSSDAGLATPAAVTGSWNQWILAIALSFANGGQSCNVKIVIFPWLPTGS